MSFRPLCAVGCGPKWLRSGDGHSRDRTSKDCRRTRSNTVFDRFRFIEDIISVRLPSQPKSRRSHVVADNDRQGTHCYGCGCCCWCCDWYFSNHKHCQEKDVRGFAVRFFNGFCYNSGDFVNYLTPVQRSSADCSGRLPLSVVSCQCFRMINRKGLIVHNRGGAYRQGAHLLF